MQIISGHHSEIWAMDVDPEERYLVTGSADPEIRFYTVKHDSDNRQAISNEKGARQSKDRVATVRFNKSGSLLACQVAGKTVDIFHVLEDVLASRKAKRRLHRKKEKKSAKGALGTTESKEDTKHAFEEDGNTPTITVSDVFKHLQTVRAGKKICSISFSPITPKSSLATLALSLNNNLLEFYSIESSTTTKTLAIELQGHRSDVRSVTLSSDNTLLMSTSHNAVKIWNPSTGSCLRTIDSDYGLCGLIIPQNKYAFVGTKSGKIEVIDIGSGTCIDTMEAHGGSVRSIAALPNENGFVTGSADHDVKFWEYQIKQKPGQDLKNLVLSNARTMKMNDDVLVVAVSPDAKYIAVALLDCTVKVFFLDSFKFFLSLYGHKLPVLCMDVSSDGDLIVTGSADKKFKDLGVWILATATNPFLLMLIVSWQCNLCGIPIIYLALEKTGFRGDFLVTGSHDRSLRRWDRTEEPFFIEEEKEKRLEEMFEADIENAFENKHVPREELPEEGAVALAGKKTQETLTATDLIIDALDVAEVELQRIAEHQEENTTGNVTEYQPNVVMLGLSPSNYVLRAFTNIHTNDLEQALLALPFSDGLKLLSYFKDWTSNPDKVELVCRVTTVLLQTHYNQLVTTPAARPVLTLLKDILYERVKESKDTLGFNLAAMDHLKQLMASRSDALFRDAKAKLLEIRSQQSKRLEARTDTKEEKRRKKKKKTSSDMHSLTGF
ncbi:hypothetical protein OIU78_002930 [Salix suchowensis]|nr:hypothetical protein OIU78_002930 [Salix suchowensis]